MDGIDMGDSTPEERAKKAAYMREWRLRPENHERVKAQQRAKHHRNRDAISEKRKAWYSENRDLDLARSKKWQQANRERANERKRAWAAANPEKVLATHRRHREQLDAVGRVQRNSWYAARRARVAANGVFVVLEKDLRRIMRAGCAYCGSPAVELDHVIPIARGGRHSIGNLVGACMSCNRRKNRRLIVEWRAAHNDTTA